MRRFAISAGRALVLAFLHVFGGPVSRASAHTLDELLQLIYVTPTATGVEIELQMTAGELVAPAFAALIDTDCDSVISDAEATSHLEVVRSAISVRFGGVAAPLRVVGSTYPDVAILRAGGGTITLLLAADSPRTETSERVVTVSDVYAPMQTIVQGSVTLSAEHPVEVLKIERGDEGRTLTVRYAHSPNV